METKKSFPSPKPPMKFSFGDVNKAKKAKIKGQIRMGGAPCPTTLNSAPRPFDVGYVVMVLDAMCIS